ncbi:ankyrin repeat domain-containing protein [Undibacterium sp. SXout7W]|uniref:ankyrin repeat domain-containing protein n=1 Tax=Undibacterium sp. SXout7W TaxID=3413049 RepID=UPI003BF077F2
MIAPRLFNLDDWRTISRAGALASVLSVILLLPILAHAEAYDDFLFAVRFNNAPVVKEFLRKGMDVNSVEGVRGETILMLALRENSMTVFDQLLKADDIKLEARAVNGDTALMLACFLGNTEAVKKLIAAGAEINQVGWAPLHYAAAKGNTDIIALLLEHFAYIDTESPNKTTPLMMAVRSGKLEAVSLLLEEGADPHLKNTLGLTALDFAEEIEQREIAALLQQKMQIKN